MKITQKPPEVVQAQIAAFVSAEVPNYQDRRYLLNNIVDLAVSQPEDINRVTEFAEFEKNEDGGTVRIPEGTESTVATSEAYTNFLRGGSRHQEIHDRAGILQEYSEFEPIVGKLKAELLDPAKRKEHPAILGSGSGSMVFQIEKNGVPYAVRLPKGKELNRIIIENHIAGAVLGRGMPHLEQIIAASYEDGVTVAEILPGKEIKKLSVEETKRISDEQLETLADTLIEANKRGITIDPKPSNTFYDPIEGFGILDYLTSDFPGRTSDSQSQGMALGFMATAIFNAGFHDRNRRLKVTKEEYDQELEFSKTKLDVLSRYREVICRKLTDQELEKALELIDLNAGDLKKIVENYSNPKWVIDDIAHNVAWRSKEEKRRVSLLNAAEGKSIENDII
jgi:hypothetical protein